MYLEPIVIDAVRQPAAGSSEYPQTRTGRTRFRKRDVDPVGEAVGIARYERANDENRRLIIEIRTPHGKMCFPAEEQIGR